MIAIKDIEMPHNCIICPLSFIGISLIYCKALERIVKQDETRLNERAAECPLLEIPDAGN